MTPLRIVIIGQWVLPMRNPRSHRTWNLALQLAKMGHDVTVYALLGTADYSEYEARYGLKIRNLGRSRWGCMDSDGTPVALWKRALHRYMNRRYHFPQIELAGMAERVVKSLTHVDLLITIASPHTIHWGAARSFTRERARCWVADCGDPYMGNPFSVAPAAHEALERDWCSKCDAIAIPVEEGRTAYYEEYRDKIAVIPQGFDFSAVELADYTPNAVPTFAFSGAVYPGQRDLNRFMQHLLTLDRPFRFIVYTRLRKHFEPWATQLAGRFEFRDYVPREQLVRELSQMDFLVNVRNKGSVQQPSKLIDYGQAGRPILDVSTDFCEQHELAAFMDGDYTAARPVGDLQRFDIGTVARQFIGLYEQAAAQATDARP